MICQATVHQYAINNFALFALVQKLQVPFNAGILAAFKWRISKNFFKRFFRQVLPVSRRQIQYFRYGFESRFPGGFTEPVPGTNILADVASVNVVSHSWAQVFRDCALQFDREIGDAERGIEQSRSDECSRRNAPWTYRLIILRLGGQARARRADIASELLSLATFERF